MKRIYKQKQGYTATIYSYESDIWTRYYITRHPSLIYELACHMSGCGTDLIITGTLATCYNELKKHIAA